MRSLGLFIGLVLLCRASLAADEIVAAADGEHLWFVQPALAPGRGFELGHHCATLVGPHFRVQTILAQQPEAMAASENRVWLVFSPKGDSVDGRREVFTMQVQFNPAFGVYYPVPQDHLEPVAALPGDGRLASFVNTFDGPAALLLPSPRFASGREFSPEPPRILRLIDSQWSIVALPEEFDSQRPAMLASAGLLGRTLVALQIAADSRRTDRFDRLDNGKWTRASLPVDLRRVLSLARANGQLVAAVDDRSDSEAHVSYLRTSQVVPLSQFERPPDSFALLGLAGWPVILETSSERKFVLRRIDPVSGEISPAETLVDQPATGQRLWQAGLILMAVAAGVLMFFAIKPLIAPPAPLPRGVVLLPPMRRLVALAIDLIPGAIFALVILRCHPTDLLGAPVIAFDIERLGPNVLMMVVTVVCCTVGELLWSTTFGKRVVGGMIVSTALSKPTFRRVLARNAVKLMVLLAPPLGLVVLLNPHMQGIEDVAGRTWVIVRQAQPSGQDAPRADNDAQ